jgi:hypothetical protein
MLPSCCAVLQHSEYNSQAVNEEDAAGRRVDVVDLVHSGWSIWCEGLSAALTHLNQRLNHCRKNWAEILRPACWNSGIQIDKSAEIALARCNVREQVCCGRVHTPDSFDLITQQPPLGMSATNQKVIRFKGEPHLTPLAHGRCMFMPGAMRVLKASPDAGALDGFASSVDSYAFMISII